MAKQEGKRPRRDKDLGAIEEKIDKALEGVNDDEIDERLDEALGHADEEDADEVLHELEEGQPHEDETPPAGRRKAEKTGRKT